MRRLLIAVLAVAAITAGLASATVRPATASDLTVVAAVKSHRTLYVTFSDDNSVALHPCKTRTARRCWWDPRRGGPGFIHLHGTTYRGFTIERTGS